MTEGKSGSFICHSNSGALTMRARVSWREEVDVQRNCSRVYITALEMSSASGGYWYPTGTVDVEGKAVVTMNAMSPATHRVELPYNADIWVGMRVWTGGAALPWVSGEIIHGSDGSRNTAIRLKFQLWRDNSSTVYFDTSQTITLTRIPRASAVAAGKSSVPMGSSVSFTIGAASASFTHDLKYSFAGQTGTIARGVSTGAVWNVPLSLAAQIPAAASGDADILCQTYLGTELIGESSVTVKLTVPNNEQTRPGITLTAEPGGDLGAAFAGLFLRGKTPVRVTVAAQSQYSSVAAIATTFEGRTLSGAKPEFPGPAGSGDVQLRCTVTDERGFASTVTRTIRVLAYDEPRIAACPGETEVICRRCLSDGTPSDAGTYLQILARRQYSGVVQDGVQKNFCLLRCRVKPSAAASYGSWMTLLEKESGEDSVRVVLAGMVPLADTSYDVLLAAEDDLGGYAQRVFPIPTEAVTFHLKEGGNGAAFGKAAELEDTLEVAFDMHLHGRRIRELGEPKEPGDAVPWGMVASLWDALDTAYQEGVDSI